MFKNTKAMGLLTLALTMPFGLLACELDLIQTADGCEEPVASVMDVIVDSALGVSGAESLAAADCLFDEECDDLP